MLPKGVAHVMFTASGKAMQCHGAADAASRKTVSLLLPPPSLLTILHSLSAILDSFTKFIRLC